MILIQLVLIAGFLILLIKFLLDPNSSQIRAWKKLIGLLFVPLAIIFVLFPNEANTVAHTVGVGRGADLLLYVLTLAFIFVCINLYMKSKQDQRRITELTRKLAILEAKISYKKSGK